MTSFLRGKKYVYKNNYNNNYNKNYNNDDYNNNVVLPGVHITKLFFSEALEITYNIINIKT